MEFVFQLVWEVLGSLVSVAVGVAVGTMALVLVVFLRRALAHVARSSEVADPRGDVWSVRVVYGLRQPGTRRLAGMTPAARRQRRDLGLSESSVAEAEIWHPKKLLDAFDEAAGLVAPFVLVGAALIVVVFVVEIVIAVPIALAFGAYSIARGRWQVERIDPGGARLVLEAGSLAEARAVAAQERQRISAGVAT